jgi:hypothetical protein
LAIGLQELTRELLEKQAFLVSQWSPLWASAMGQLANPQELRRVYYGKKEMGVPPDSGTGTQTTRQE